MSLPKGTLVVVAHPDDETLGCGGTLSNTYQPTVMVFCKTRASRHLTTACKILGVPYRQASGLGDQALDQCGFTTLVGKIESVVEQTRPQVIFTHHVGDLNLDHRLTARAVLTACRPGRFPSVRRILSCEIPSSTDWTCGQLEPRFTPNVFQPLTEDALDRKCQAMEAYESERRLPPHPRSREHLRALAMYRGQQAGVRYAEAFQLLWECTL